MEILGLSDRLIDKFGSHDVSMRQLTVAERSGIRRVHVASVAAGGVLGRHPARDWQLFVVVAGTAWVAGPDGERHELKTGEGVLWAPGEDHESGADEPMIAVLVEFRARPVS